MALFLFKISWFINSRTEGPAGIPTGFLYSAVTALATAARKPRVSTPAVVSWAFISPLFKLLCKDLYLSLLLGTPNPPNPQRFIFISWVTKTKAWWSKISHYRLPRFKPAEHTEKWGSQSFALTAETCPVWLFVTPWTAAHQASLSMGFSRREFWSGLPFPAPGDLPYPGIEPASLASAA